MTISQKSEVADVAVYVGQELALCEFVDEIKQFILDQEINGRVFLYLTDQKLKDWGMKSGGRRDVLMNLVKTIKQKNVANRV
jgi:hypothetical protein